MDETTTQELTDEDIRTVMPGTAESPKAETDPDTMDQRRHRRRHHGQEGRGRRRPGRHRRQGRRRDRQRRHGRDRQHVVSQGTLERVGADRRPLERCAGDPRSFLENDWGARAAVRLGARQRRRRVRGPALARRRRPVPHDDRAADAVLPAREGGRTDRRVGVHAHPVAPGSREVEGIADPARVAALFEDGATIVLQGLHRWSDPVTRFCRDLELELGHPCQVNAYITPRRRAGLGPARGRARRLRPAGVRPQALGGARGAARRSAGSSRRRGRGGRHDLHACRHASRRASPGRRCRATSRSAST